MQYALYAATGLFSGLCFYFLAKYQIKVRSLYDTEHRGDRINKLQWTIPWMVIPALLFTFIGAMDIDYWQTVRYMLIILMAVNVAGVDLLIRRIPNSILLGMIVLHIANIIIVTLETDGMLFDAFLSAIAGLVIGYVIFVIPGIFKLKIGAGDVKYSAVIGFMMGFGGYVQSMAVMGILICIYYIFLKVSRTGNLKTAAPMAPFLSGGVLVTMFFPLF